MGVFVTSYFLLDHVRFRINNFFENVGDNYQINKSLESFANGGLFGQGLGNGNISKSLPDAHSDFIFALIGEEFGILAIVYNYLFISNYIFKNFFYLSERLIIFSFLILL